LRVGVLRHFHERDVPAGAEMLQVVAMAVRLMQELGCRVEEAALPSVHEYNAVARVIISAEAYALHEANLRDRLSDYSRTFRVRVLAGGLIRAADYLAAQRGRTDLIADTARAFARFDLLVSAAVLGPAPLLRDQRPDEGFAVPFLTAPANVAAIPAAVVCAGFTARGLPLGLQIMGPAWGEGLVLRLAHHLEEAAGTRSRRPDLAASLAEPAARVA
jgi:aspartyl-tRNA(Asn)/glutamyl-tRNA(Gln) amidotransferase subunit A